MLSSAPAVRTAANPLKRRPWQRPGRQLFCCCFCSTDQLMAPELLLTQKPNAAAANILPLSFPVERRGLFTSACQGGFASDDIRVQPPRFSSSSFSFSGSCLWAGGLMLPGSPPSRHENHGRGDKCHGPGHVNMWKEEKSSRGRPRRVFFVSFSALFVNVHFV